LANTLRGLAQVAPEGPQREQFFDQAWSIADAMVREHPYNPDAWNNRGVSAMWLVQLAHRPMDQVARDSFMRASQMDPVFVDAWANLAKWEHLAGHLENEKTYWRKVLEIDPQQAMARYVLGATPNSK
jgi:hypothetical protein